LNIVSPVFDLFKGVDGKGMSQEIQTFGFPALS